MARKSSIHKRADITYIVPPGTEPEHERFLAAQAAYEAAWAKKDGPEWVRNMAVAQRAMFGSFDAWHNKVKHLHDKVNASQEDLRALITASLSDKLDELAFTVNPGLLGNAVSREIHLDTSEEEIGDPPLCENCA